jgi:hypothetical protein
LLGLYNSIWHWYRPNGAISMDEVTEFFIRRQLALLGLPPELADGAKAGAGGAKAPAGGAKAPAARRRAGGNRRSG